MRFFVSEICCEAKLVQLLLRMPLPANFHSTAEDVLKAYPQNLVTVTCDNKTGEDSFTEAAVAAAVHNKGIPMCRGVPGGTLGIVSTIPC